MPIFSSISAPPKKDSQTFDNYMLEVFNKLNNIAGIVIETTATRTVAITDNHIICNRAGTITLTLPNPAISGPRVINVRTWTANTVVSATSNVVGATGGAAATAILAATAGRWADLVSDGTNWVIVRNG